MTRRLLILATVLAPLLVPSAAFAAGDSTLLSGYGGPGGGEQSVLGSKLLPAQRGIGSLKAAIPGAARSGTPAAAVAGAAARPATGAAGDGATATGRPPAGDDAPSGRRSGAKQSRRAAGTTTRKRRSGTARPASAPAGVAAATPTASAERVAYPGGDSGSTLPLGGSDLLLLLLGLLVIALAGAATWGLTHGTASRGPRPQS